MTDKPRCPICKRPIGGAMKDCRAMFDEGMGGDDVRVLPCDGEMLTLNVRDVLQLRAALVEALDRWHDFAQDEGIDDEIPRIAELRKLVP